MKNNMFNEREKEKARKALDDVDMKELKNIIGSGFHINKLNSEFCKKEYEKYVNELLKIMEALNNIGRLLEDGSYLDLGSTRQLLIKGDPIEMNIMELCKILETKLVDSCMTIQTLFDGLILNQEIGDSLNSEEDYKVEYRIGKFQLQNSPLIRSKKENPNKFMKDVLGINDLNDFKGEEGREALNKLFEEKIKELFK